MKEWIAVTLAVGLLLPCSAAQAAVIDDYSVDTSANYTYSNSYGGGGSFNVSGGVLNILAAGGNTACVVLNDGANFMETGERWSVEAPAPKTNSFFMISTTAAQPNGSSTRGFRFRRDGTFRLQRYTTRNSNTSGSGTVSNQMLGSHADAGGAVTFQIERTSAADFRFYKQYPSQPREFLAVLSLKELASNPQLHVGMQNWATPQAFDNLTEENLPGTVASFSQGAGGYSGTSDTYIASFAATADQSAATRIRQVGSYSGGESQYLVRFDDIFGGGAGQIPLGATIHSATLAVQTGSTKWDGTSDNAVVRAHRLLQGFSDTDTWNGSFGGDGVGLDGVEASATADYVRGNLEGIYDGDRVPFDVTASLQAWSGGDANHGWVVTQNASGSNNWYFSSAEGGTAPELYVYYTATEVVPEPATICALGLAVAGLGGYVRRRRKA